MTDIPEHGGDSMKKIFLSTLLAIAACSTTAYCNISLSVGDAVIYVDSNDLRRYEFSTEATILKMLPDNKAIIEFFDGGGVNRHRTVGVEELAFSKGCTTENFCTKDKAMHIAKYPNFDFSVTVDGTIDGFFLNDNIVVGYFDGGGIYHRKVLPSNSVARTKGCTNNGFCVGQRVQFISKDEKGTIAGIFPDQRVAVEIDSDFAYNSAEVVTTHIINHFK